MLPNIPEIEHPERFSDFEIPKEKLQLALDRAIEKIDMALPTFIDKFPSESSKGNVYQQIPNEGGWGQGFWSGILWHAYELTGKEEYRSTVLDHHVGSFYKRISEKIGVNHHDMGFLFSLSCVAAYKLCGDEKAKEAALLAADNLITRYNEKAKMIQAWGAVGDPEAFRLIIDCLLNIPLLYWASDVTGDKKYAEIAYNHFSTTADVILRPDGSTHHTYYFDLETGLPKYGKTKQGANDDSAWGRGQAWGMYGPMLTHTYMKDEKSMGMFKVAANYFLNNLPYDYVPYWDLMFHDGSAEPRDTSAASCALCALLEAIKWMDDKDPLKKIYKNAANRMMNALIDSYTTYNVPQANGLLLHAVYWKGGNYGVDEMNIWGCYFYMEALHRMLDPEWKLYW